MLLVQPRFTGRWKAASVLPVKSWKPTYSRKSGHLEVRSSEKQYMQNPRIAEINRYWANRLNCSPNVLEQSGTIILPCKQPQDYSRIVITRISKQAIVQVPAELVEPATDRLDTAQIVTADHIKATFTDEELEIGWRDFIWYFSANADLPQPDDRVRLLSSGERLNLDELLSACSERDRELGNVSIEQEFPLGLFENNNLLAVAAFIFDSDAIADVGVITHPHHRGKGLGKSIVLELVRHGIEHGRIVQYSTQEQNIGSKRLAESIGFWLYAVEEGLYLE